MSTINNLKKWWVTTNAGLISNDEATNPISWIPPGAKANIIASGLAPIKKNKKNYKRYHTNCKGHDYPDCNANIVSRDFPI
jgi:hypothetical protein